MKFASVFLISAALAVFCGNANAQYYLRRGPVVVRPPPYQRPYVFGIPRPAPQRLIIPGQTAGATPYMCGPGGCRVYKSWQEGNVGLLSPLFIGMKL